MSEQLLLRTNRQTSKGIRNSQLQLGEGLLVHHVDLGAAALLVARTTAVTLRSALRSALESALGALEVSAVVGASLAGNEVVSVLHGLEVEDHLGLLLLLLHLLALLLLVLVALRLRLTRSLYAYHEVVLLHFLQLLTFRGLHGAGRLLAQQLAHLGLALRLVLLQGEHHLALSNTPFPYGLGLSNLLLGNGGLVQGLGLILPTRHRKEERRTDGPWHPWGYPSFWDRIRSWGSHGYARHILTVLLTHGQCRCGDRTHACQGAGCRH